ncbi:MAG: radical SAM protein [Sphaerochaetaceae bacterium]
MKTIPTTVLRAGLRLVYADPERNLPKFVNWMETFAVASGSVQERQLKLFRQIIQNPNSGGYGLIIRMLHQINREVLEKLIMNFVFNGAWFGTEELNKNRTEMNMNIPWAILMDPTATCNLSCTGCWTTAYKKTDELSFGTLNRIITEGKKLGTYAYFFSGGEPLLRKQDLIRLAQKHQDVIFSAFTNATLIDSSFAEALLTVKNFIPIISIEGSETLTDARRGKGVWKQCIHAMNILSKKGLVFGFSVCYHAYNTEYVGSDEFIQDMITKGALFGWYFTYIPIGTDASPSMVASPQQRAYILKRVREIRSNNPLFVLDFWNDSNYVNGCIAGGRRYMHINAHGDLEPCAFIHYACETIYGKPLSEALKNPLFEAYREHQPFNTNMFRSCPLLDNPEILMEMVHATGAESTQYADVESVEQLCKKCKPIAEKWKPTADKLWKDFQGNTYKNMQ